jgi:hypothetical protein
MSGELNGMANYGADVNDCADPISFRSDLDEGQQFTDMDLYLRQRVQESNLKEWRATCRPKDDHVHMLCMLVVEAHRRQPDKVPKARVKELIGVIKNTMNESTDTDEYLLVLQRLSKLALFGHFVDVKV